MNKIVSFLSQDIFKITLSVPKYDQLMGLTPQLQRGVYHHDHHHQI
jgi:hypothetical protein